MNYRTPLSRARGLGAAHSGTAHFIALRFTSWILLPLTVWFVVAMAYLANSDYAQAAQWFHHPLNAICFTSFLLMTLWHASLGLQVVIEDYIHSETLKLALLLLLKAGIALLAISGFYLMIYLAFGPIWALVGSFSMAGVA